MKRVVIGSVSILTLSSYCFSYEQPTHQELSEAAAKQSTIFKNAGFITQLGYRSGDAESLYLYYAGGGTRTILDLIRKGATDEDDGAQSLHHFYNPVDGSPLSTAYPYSKSSPQWALSDPANKYNLDAFYSAYYSGLTSRDVTRDKYFSAMFESLGHIIHHVQDMAQPEHVRDDPHLIVPVFNYEWDPSLYESYSMAQVRDKKLDGLISTASAPIHMPSAISYWDTNNNDGLAEFTNSNFVSKDSNFALDGNNVQINDRFARPAPLEFVDIPLSDPTLLGAEGERLCQELKASILINPPPIDDLCNITFVTSRVTGNHPSVNTINERASTISFFDQYLLESGGSAPLCSYLGASTHCISDTYRVTTLNRFNYDSHHQYLIPRAINYSAGLIDFAFRGKIDVKFNGYDSENDVMEFEITNKSSLVDQTYNIDFSSNPVVALTCDLDYGSRTFGQLTPIGTTLSYEQTIRAHATIGNACRLQTNSARVKAIIYGNSGSDKIIATGDVNINSNGASAQTGTYIFDELIGINDFGDLTRTSTVRFKPNNGIYYQEIRRNVETILNGSVEVEDGLTWVKNGITYPARQNTYFNYHSREFNCSGGCSSYRYNGTQLQYYEFGKWWTAESELERELISFSQKIENFYPSVGKIPSGMSLPSWQFTTASTHYCAVSEVSRTTEYINAATKSFTLWQEKWLITPD